MADALNDLGEHVPDRTLVLNLIHGLNDKFTSIGLHLQSSVDVPSRPSWRSFLGAGVCARRL